MLLQWLLLLGLAVAGTIRWLRWAAIAQQKEYRFDRWWQFSRSAEGSREWLRVWFGPHDLTRAGLRRPRLTPRALVMLLLSGGIWLASWLTMVVAQSWLLTMVIGGLVLALIPALVMASTLPSWLATQALVLVTLWRARQRLLAAQPVVIGVGGCYGKTTTKLLLHHLLSQAKPTFVTPLSYNARYSVAKSLLAGYTNQPWAVIEYGSYKRGEITELAGWFPPQIGMTTGFTEQHLALFGSIANIIAAEGELVAALPAGAAAFYHAADPGAGKIARSGAARSHAKLIPYTGEQAVVTLEQIKLDKRGQLQFSWHGQTIQTKLVGEHYAVNVQGAIAVAEHLGVTADQIVAGLQSFVPNQRFVQTYDVSADGVLIDDGYAANPAGFAAMIELVQAMQRQHHYARTVLLFAGIVDLGDQTDQLHRQMGALAQPVVSEVMYLGAVGQAAFQAGWEQPLMTDSTAALKLLSAPKPDTLIVVEGRLAAQVEAALAKIRR